MELEEIIPKNSYKQPKDVREMVAKGVVRALFKGIEYETPLVICSQNRGVYLRNRELRLERGTAADIRVRGVEMEAAFDALRKAGYYLYSYYDEAADVTSYVWSRKPMRGRQMPMFEPKFRTFID